MAKNNASLSFDRSPLRAPLTWYDFAWLGDEWLVVYAHGHQHSASVTLFALAHAVELYLKACVAKCKFDVIKQSGHQGMTDNEMHEQAVSETVQLAHKLDRMWRDLKGQIPGFMPGYELIESICDLAFSDDEEKIRSGMSVGERENFDQHRELYLVVKYCADLKYLGGPMKKRFHPMFYFEYQNKYWIAFFSLVRNWLFPQRGKFADHLSIILSRQEESRIPQFVFNYLKPLAFYESGPPTTVYSYRRISDTEAIEYTHPGLSQSPPPEKPKNDDLG